MPFNRSIHRALDLSQEIGYGLRVDRSAGLHLVLLRFTRLCITLLKPLATSAERDQCFQIDHSGQQAALALS